MRLLLVTCRNIDKNGGENALIMGRHSALYKQFDIKTDILFFHKDTKEINSEYPGMEFIPCQKDNLYTKMDEMIATGEYTGVVVSGFYDTIFNKYIIDKRKDYNFKYILDIHATIKEIYEYCIPDLYHILGTRYLYIKKKKKFIETIKVVDYAFIVSEEEIIEVNKYLPKNNIKFIKIRCGCYQRMRKDEYYLDRKEERFKLGIDDDALAFVYSGSTDRWQKYEETVKLFKRIKNTGIKCKFAFYMRLEDAARQQLYADLGEKNVSVRWVSPEQMKKELRAYDVGVMLRDNKWTNRVAFPNKFSDYLAGGLHLALSEAVVDPYKITQQYKLDLFDVDNINNSIETIRNVRLNNLNEYITICEEIVEKELLYDVQVKKEFAQIKREMEYLSK